MKILWMVLVVVFVVATAGYCKQQYNPNANRWETVPDNSDWSSRYNPNANDWSLQPDNAQVEYNPNENSWDWDSGHNPGSDD